MRRPYSHLIDKVNHVRIERTIGFPQLHLFLTLTNWLSQWGNVKGLDSCHSLDRLAYSWGEFFLQAKKNQQDGNQVARLYTDIYLSTQLLATNHITMGSSVVYVWRQRHGRLSAVPHVPTQCRDCRRLLKRWNLFLAFANRQNTQKKKKLFQRRKSVPIPKLRKCRV
jgi:hypothetical protein